jgi:putative FmdB family regulatory protein
LFSGIPGIELKAINDLHQTHLIVDEFAGYLPVMPIYEYQLCDGDCKVCGGRFTLRRPLSAAPLTACPACKKPVKKLLSTFNSPTKLKPLSVTDAKKAGFTVLKKIGKGEYERQ